MQRDPCTTGPMPCKTITNSNAERCFSVGVWDRARHCPREGTMTTCAIAGQGERSDAPTGVPLAMVVVMRRLQPPKQTFSSAATTFADGREGRTLD